MSKSGMPRSRIKQRAARPRMPAASVAPSACLAGIMAAVNHRDQKVVLAYSGGLDTSAIAKWLQLRRGCEVVCFTADIGQGEEVEDAREKASALGVTDIRIEDLREAFARDYVFPMFRANAIYEGNYLLGSAIARPLIARRLVEIAAETGADAIAHGATGKGNDQLRFELGAHALSDGIEVIAPWREWEFGSRAALMAFCAEHGIETAARDDGGSPYSTDANLLHISYEGGPLEDPARAPDESMWRWTVAPEAAPDAPECIALEYRRGDPTAIDGETLSPASLLARLNALGSRHGIGRLDIVENRRIGMKSRGCYETPGGTIMLAGHRAIESITLDGEAAHLKDELMPRYAALIYNGLWFSPERLMLQRAIDESQVPVNGTVRLKLYRGSVTVTGRESGDSLLDPGIATFEDDAGRYDQGDAGGFIALSALRLKIAAAKNRTMN